MKNVIFVMGGVDGVGVWFYNPLIAEERGAGGGGHGGKALR